MKTRRKAMGILSLAVITALTSLGAAQTTHASDFSHFSSYMGIGSRATEVRKLQTFLANEQSIYPEGLITGYFGPLTKAAVIQFQLNFNLGVDGLVGPQTRLELNRINDTRLDLDVNAATMSNIGIQNNGSNTTLTWTASEPVRGGVYYSTQPLILRDYNDYSVGLNRYPSATFIIGSSGNFNSSQNINLSGLNPGTTYYYMAESTDASGNLTITTPASFVAN